MSTRKIKDAKDLSTNELIYFKGHAQATYMSDGTTVEDAINNIEVTGGVVDTSNFVQYNNNNKEITANIINGEYATSINIDKYGLIFGPSSKKTYVTVHAEGDGTKFLADDGSYKTIGTGGGSGAYAEVNHGTSDTTFTLTPNTFHVWDEVASLDLSFANEQAGVANEYIFQFTSGATATTLTLPDGLKWTNNSAPTIAENKIYQISILKGLSSVLEFNNVKIITFTFNNMTYQAEEGMSWADYIVSKYNDGTFYTNGIQISTNYGYLYINGNTVALSAVIQANGDYYAQQGSGGA